MQLSSSETARNLMRAFAGESQARNRYTFAASVAKSQNLHVIESLFTFTANQEKEHAEIFYSHLKDLSSASIDIAASFPVNVTSSVAELLRFAKHNEYEEHDPIYRSFGDVAKNEGFQEIARLFYSIADIEKTHGDRFSRYLELVERDTLFASVKEHKWMCLNCGYIHTDVASVGICPVCSHNKGYFIRLESAPFEGDLA